MLNDLENILNQFELGPNATSKCLLIGDGALRHVGRSLFGCTIISYFVHFNSITDIRCCNHSVNLIVEHSISPYIDSLQEFELNELTELNCLRALISDCGSFVNKLHSHPQVFYLFYYFFT